MPNANLHARVLTDNEVVLLDAAPDLLAACEKGARSLQLFLDELDPEMKDDNDDDVTALREMQAAIAKARGQ